MAFRLPISRLGQCQDLQTCHSTCEQFFPAGHVDMEATTIPAVTACFFCSCSAKAHLQRNVPPRVLSVNPGTTANGNSFGVGDSASTDPFKRNPEYCGDGAGTTFTATHTNASRPAMDQGRAAQARQRQGLRYHQQQWELHRFEILLPSGVGTQWRHLILPKRKKNKGTMGTPTVTGSSLQSKSMDQEFTVALIEDTAAVYSETMACTKNAKPRGYEKNTTFPNLFWITLQPESPNIPFEWKPLHARNVNTKPASDDDYLDSEDDNINGQSHENLQDTQEKSPGTGHRPNTASESGGGIDGDSLNAPPKMNKASMDALKKEPEEVYSHREVPSNLSLDELLPTKSHRDSASKPSLNTDPLLSGQTDDSSSNTQHLPPSDYHVILRLLHYMQTPDDVQLWVSLLALFMICIGIDTNKWAEKPHMSFQHFETSMTMLEGVLHMFKTNPAMFSSQQIIIFLTETIYKAPLSDWVWLDAVSGPWTSSDESEFDLSFIISPGALGIVLSYLKYIYGILDHELADCRNDVALFKVRTFYVAFLTVICNLLAKFRLKHAHEHHLWDPDGFRELSTLLAKYDKCLTVAKSSHHMYQLLKKIDLETMTPAQVQFDLTSAFHDSSNLRMMYADVVVGGWKTQKSNKVPEHDPSITPNMTNTALLQSQWYCDIEENQPNIQLRRELHHPGVANKESSNRTTGGSGAKVGRAKPASTSTSNHKPKHKPKPAPCAGSASRPDIPVTLPDDKLTYSLKKAKLLQGCQLPLAVLLSHVLAQFLHPNRTKHPPLKEFMAKSLKAHVHVALLLYHYDKNVSECTDFQECADEKTEAQTQIPSTNFSLNVTMSPLKQPSWPTLFPMLK
ncbi:hypothetical protein IW261DRAFT_1420713 [Armillaria novae-zelandiae]|uniref:Uncharacterized protein n=1 Tax=Armillaria novae-zelandiae TaxID=153914 RepID=A0AA39P5B4_9AGAR|nr:hypothetical protein IW261DRAFT_1420713 [Armillaria novae-zelandiae]